MYTSVFLNPLVYQAIIFHFLANCSKIQIIGIVDILVPPSPEEFEDVYIVSDLMETDLHRIINSKQELTPDHVQYFLYQVCASVLNMYEEQVVCTTVSHGSAFVGVWISTDSKERVRFTHKLNNRVGCCEYIFLLAVSRLATCHLSKMRAEAGLRTTVVAQAPEEWLGNLVTSAPTLHILTHRFFGLVFLNGAAADFKGPEVHALL